MDPKAFEHDYQLRTLHRNVEHIRGIAEAQNMHLERSTRGAYEVRVADTQVLERQGELLRSTLERGNEIALEWNGNLVRLAEVESENGKILCALSQTANRSHAVLVDLCDIGTQGLTLLTASLGVQLDIEQGVRQLQEIGIEQMRLQGITIREIYEQGDLTRDEMGRQGALTRYEMGRQAELTRTQDRGIGELLDQRLTKLGILHRQDVTWLDRAMEHRHRELYKLVEKLADAVINPLLTQAEERYRQAVDHQTIGHVGRALDALCELYALDATHVPGRVLFGDIAQDCGVPEVARVAYAEAVAYARVNKNMEGFVASTLRLARLERAVGNYEAGIKAIQSALNVVPWDSPLHKVLRYEEIVAIYAQPDRTADLPKIARWLRHVLIADPGRRDQVEKDPFWVEVVASDPYLRYGNAPYVRLAECWMGLAGDECVDVYTQALVLCELGRKSHPQVVGNYLEWLQERVLSGSEPRSLIVNVTRIDDHEQLLLYVFRERRLQGKEEEAWRVLDRGTWPGLDLPRVEFEFFNRTLPVSATERELVLHAKTQLRRILRAAPELRNVVASDESFAAYRAACPWLEAGNTQDAPLVESMAVFDVHFGDEEEAKVQLVVWESFHALQELCKWVKELIGSTFIFWFNRDPQNVLALVNEVSPTIHVLADRLTDDAPSSVPLSVERWCTVMEEQYSAILLSVLMIHPFAYGWNDDHERWLQSLYWLDPDAAEHIDTSPFFARLREARAADAKRKLDEQRERERLLLVEEQAQRERQKALQAAEDAARREQWQRARLEAEEKLRFARSQLRDMWDRLKYRHSPFEAKIKDLLRTSDKGPAWFKEFSDEALTHWAQERTHWAQEQTTLIAALLQEIKEQDRKAYELQVERERLWEESKEAELERKRERAAKARKNLLVLGLVVFLICLVLAIPTFCLYVLYVHS